jgi:predicted nucleic acid-binding protein
MAQRLIFNTSPLVFLSRIGGLDWIPKLSSGRAQIPRAVIHEILEGADGEPIVQELKNRPTFSISDDAPISPLVSVWDLGPGETQVIDSCLADQGATAVLDDNAARKCAKSLDIPVVGTVGLVLAAKEEGIIPKARPVIEELRKNGLYLSGALTHEVLNDIGE